jgi:hypothetical protein
MEGGHTWLERGILPLGFSPADFRPRPFTPSAAAPETERVPAARG